MHYQIKILQDKPNQREKRKNLIYKLVKHQRHLENRFKKLKLKMLIEKHYNQNSNSLYQK